MYFITFLKILSESALRKKSN